jgi:hypothetical protein
MTWMLGMNALGVVPIVVGGAVLLFAGLSAIPMACAMVLAGRSSRAEDELAEAIVTARHPKQTLMQTHCPDCGHVGERAIPFRGDLGAVCEQWKRCLACRMEQKQTIEIDLDKLSAAEIGHALDNLSEPKVSAPMPAVPDISGAAHP